MAAKPTYEQLKQRVRELETQLQQAQKMGVLGTMTGGIAHDFNNILSSIILNAEMARDDSPKSSDIRKSLEQILRGGQRARELVEHILIFSRNMEVTQQPLNISIIVKETLKMLKSILPATIIIEKAIASKIGIIMADPTQIQQLVMNLCTNAAHAMEKNGGKLKVKLHDVYIRKPMPFSNLSPGNYVKLIVQDSGHGIAHEHKDRIFDPFFTTKNPGEGTGLGLSTAHRIVKGYGGAITVDSMKDKGTKFEVFFPINKGEAASIVKDRSPLPTGKERLLFVDDEECIIEVGQKILERLGYKIITATSGAEAVELFRISPEGFDLVVTDTTMPYMTGIDLSKKLLAIRKDIPIIICTGYNQIVTPEKAKAIGIRDYIVKPFNSRQMANTIRKILDRKLAERRKHRRFHIASDAVTILKSGLRPGIKYGFPKPCKIIDISKSGLSFYYHESKSFTGQFFEIDISMPNNDHNIDKLSCKTVSDFAMADSLKVAHGKIRRRGIQFKKMTPAQTDQIEYFINYNTVSN